MPSPQILAGPRVRLRPPVVEDAEALYAEIASDGEVTRYLSWRPHSGVAETRRVITTLFNVGDELTWLVEIDGDVRGCAPSGAYSRTRWRSATAWPGRGGGVA